MGLKQDQLEFIFSCIDQKYSQYPGLRMLELGNQVLKIDGTRRSAKPYFEEMGFEHVSVDINGKDGALPIDLSVSIGDTLKKQYDVVTNSGVSEHVEPFRSQYQCFKNIHDFVRVGGLMIHAVPHRGHYPNHCRFYYDENFFRYLSELNDYHILDLRVIRSGKLVCAGLVKQHDQEFTRLAREVRKHIIIQPCARKTAPRTWRARAMNYIERLKEVFV